MGRGKQIDFGININKTQYDIATNKCSGVKNIQLYLGDFLNFKFHDKYDLVYFIESAFHIKDKERLVGKIADICTEYSDVYITDIVYSEKFAAKARKNEVQSTIFEYCSLKDWVQLFENKGFEFVEFDNLSQQVANVITITTPPADFKKEFVLPIVQSYENKEVYTNNIMHAFTSYSKLQRLLKMEVLKYGIMRFRKSN
jgi:SAM-dependent methyltransferase